MTKIDLITGFLGAGKTTFLKKYIQYLLSQKKKICILEFDYGAVNVDMMLLQEFEGLCDMEMIAGGCDFDCHIRRFKTKLIAMGMKKYDYVIVEPSGIFDVDEFFDCLYDEPLCDWYEIGSVISIVDPISISSITPEENYLFTSQIACSGSIIFSKTQNYSNEQINTSIEQLDLIMKDNGMILKKDEIYTKPFSEFNDEDFASISQKGYDSQSFMKKHTIQNNNFSSLYFMNTAINKEKLHNIVTLLFQETAYGSIKRVKGFFKESDQWFVFNATKQEENIEAVQLGQDVIIVIGENLEEVRIQALFE